jgi:hypothetical protein
VVLQEPDFTGLFTIGPTGASPVLRDAARGWTYFNAQFGAANVEGVTFTGLFRVSDSGLPDTQWRVLDTPQFTEQYLAADGAVIGRAYVKNSSAYEKPVWPIYRRATVLISRKTAALIHVRCRSPTARSLRTKWPSYRGPRTPTPSHCASVTARATNSGHIR